MVFREAIKVSHVFGLRVGVSSSQGCHACHCMCLSEGLLCRGYARDQFIYLPLGLLPSSVLFVPATPNPLALKLALKLIGFGQGSPKRTPASLTKLLKGIREFI